jgi:hypothetical protein
VQPSCAAFALPRFRLTPVRLVGLAAAAVVAGLYVWGIFFYGDEPDADAIEVEWIQVDPPALSSPENARPYFGRLPPGEDVWRAYIVAEGGEPRLALESHRLLTSSRWTQEDEHLILSALSENVTRQQMTGICRSGYGEPRCRVGAAVSHDLRKRTW